MAGFIETKINYFNSLKKIKKHKNYAYYLQVLGLTWFPVQGENTAVIFRIEDNFFQQIPYDFKQPSELPLKIFFSEKRQPRFKKYSIKKEVTRTLKYVYKYIKQHDIENLVYSQGHPLPTLTPIMLSTGDDIKLITAVLENNIHPYTLAMLINQNIDRETVLEIVDSLSDSMINKIYS